MEKDRLFLSLVCMSQSELKKFLEKELILNYGSRNVICRDGYLMARGETPVTLIAHLDTIHKTLTGMNDIIINGDCVTSKYGIGGDDRCGIWVILSLIRQGMKPTIIFTEDEDHLGGSYWAVNDFNFIDDGDKVIIKINDWG